MCEMKDSGIEWIGEIPKDWEFPKITHVLDYTHPYPIGDGDHGTIKAENYSEEGIPFIRVQNLGFATELIMNNLVYITEKQNNGIINSTLYPNDILFAKTGATIGKVGIMPENIKKANTTSHVGKITVSEEAVPKFIFYVLSSFIGYKQFWDIALMKSTRPELSIDEIKTLHVLLPKTLVEQQQIVDYLDTKCSAIDATAEDIQKEISLLEDYKKSVITEAVTKGLNPDAEMKDSGIKWIGEIPKDWEVLRFDYLLYERTEKNSPIITDERLALSIDKGITLYSEKTTNLDRFKEDVSQYKIAYVGDFVMNMIVGAVDVSPYFGCVSPAYYVFYDDNAEHYICRFCNYLFHTPVLKKVLYSLGKGIMAIDRGDGKVNTCRLKVSRYDLAKLKIPVPINREIIKIVDFLDTKCSAIDTLIADKKRQLDILADYKKSLIYEYVTGKKEVPVNE